MSIASWVWQYPLSGFSSWRLTPLNSTGLPLMNTCCLPLNSILRKPVPQETLSVTLHGQLPEGSKGKLDRLEELLNG